MCWKWCVRTRLHGSPGRQRTQSEQHNGYARRQTLWMKQCNRCSPLKVLKESRELQPSTISDNGGFPSTTGGSGLTTVNKKCGLASNKVFGQLQSFAIETDTRHFYLLAHHRRRQNSTNLPTRRLPSLPQVGIQRGPRTTRRPLLTVRPRAAVTTVKKGISVVDGCIISGEGGAVAQLECQQR